MMVRANINDRQITIRSHRLEDEYRVTESIDGTYLLVENLSVPDSCVLYVGSLDPCLGYSYQHKDWNTFITYLIEMGKLT